jgi:hypothetical protein
LLENKVPLSLADFWRERLGDPIALALARKSNVDHSTNSNSQSVASRHDAGRFRSYGALVAALSVRRQSVTTTLHVLEGKHLVTSARGVVTMRDREGLEELAGDAYGIPEREYNSLIRLSR